MLQCRPEIEEHRKKVTSDTQRAIHSTNGSVIATLPRVLGATNWNGVAIDSREVRPGDLFVALPGERADGHSYVAHALERGTSAALVRRDWAVDAAAALPFPVAVVTDPTVETLQPPALIAVDDPLKTLQAWAAEHRSRFDLPVIGITGSVGKTSTKELLAAVLRQRLVTLANVKSFNNEIGLPLTLLQLGPEHQAAVLEMGTYGPGDIALLCAMARPRYAVELNVGASHLERMRTYETVARAKAELVEALPPDGVAILNGDDHRVRAMRERTTARSVLFGLDPSNDIWADAVESRGLDGIAFTLHMHGDEQRLELPLIGRHHVYTALAVIAVARELDLRWDAIAAGLGDVKEQPRLIVRPGMHDATLIDDTYNASPASCQAALDVLAEMPGRRIAVFGDMAELGPEEVAGHQAVGRAAAAVVDLLVAVGAKARLIGEAALRAPLKPEVLFATTNAEATELLLHRLRAGDYVLVKGARVAATEQIVAALGAKGVE
jgi:UDP-N-acetylmuramoyl-tripeptide--D-alanyl-D-alanine ligase